MHRQRKILIILVLILIVCIVLLIVYRHRVSASSGNPTDISGDITSASGETGAQSPDSGSGKSAAAASDDSGNASDSDVSSNAASIEITITASGDCTLGKTQDQGYSGSFYDYYDLYGPDYFFENVRDIFESDDITIVNLECVLSTATEHEEKEFNLKGEPEYVEILSGSSVEACSLGNNHTYDYGEEGFDETKGVLDAAGIVYAYSSQSGMYKTDGGTKIGIVSAGLLSQSAERVAALKEQMAALRADGAALIIACCHWGVEREYYPTEYQQDTAHELIDAGADLIIGNHPHVLQGVEVYKGKVICYSLGNFCFGGNTNPSDKNTVLFSQTFTISGGAISTEGIDARIIPCRLSSADGYNDYQPYAASGDTRQEIIDLVNEYSSPYGETYFNADGILCP